MDENLISIGRLARVASVSQRTLRYYQRIGLLTPAFVDEDTSYRYYRADQFPDIQAIRQLQAIGLTLEEIAGYKGGKRVSELRERILDQINVIEAKQQELETAHYLAEEMLENCNLFIEQPLFDEIMLENRHEQAIRLFNLDEMNLSADDTRDNIWLQVKEYISHTLSEEGRSMISRNFGGFISEEQLREGLFEFNSFFVYVDENQSSTEGETGCIPHGSYLTMYVQHYDPENNGELAHQEEIRRLRQMMDYADVHGFEICGGYYDEAIVGSSFFGYEGNDLMYRMSLPVRRK